MYVSVRPNAVPRRGYDFPIALGVGRKRPFSGPHTTSMVATSKAQGIVGAAPEDDDRDSGENGDENRVEGHGVEGVSARGESKLHEGGAYFSGGKSELGVADRDA